MARYWKIIQLSGHTACHRSKAQMSPETSSLECLEHDRHLWSEKCANCKNGIRSFALNSSNVTFMEWSHFQFPDQNDCQI